LQEALKKMQQQKYGPAINMLEAFIHNVKEHSDLDVLTNEQAEELISAAQACNAAVPQN
jgi:hypothetical protein